MPYSGVLVEVLTKRLFSIKESRPSIKPFRHKSDLSGIDATGGWIDSKTLQFTIPLSNISRDPWGDGPTLQAKCGEGDDLTLEETGIDSWKISLTEISKVHLNVIADGAKREWTVQPKFTIEKGELNSRGHPKYVITGRKGRYKVEIFNQTRNRALSSTDIYVTGNPTEIELMDKETWLSLNELSIIVLKILNPLNIEQIFHQESAEVEPAPISAFTPSVRRQLGRFENGTQKSEFVLSGLHPTQVNSNARIKWEGEDYHDVQIVNGSIVVDVPLVKSSKCGFLEIPPNNARIDFGAYSQISVHNCSLFQKIEEIQYTHDNRERQLIHLAQTGDWTGHLRVELATKKEQSDETLVLLTHDIYLPRCESEIYEFDITLGWLMEKIPQFKDKVLSCNQDASFGLNFSLYCDNNEVDNSETICLEMSQPVSIIEISAPISFDEGREDTEEVLFSYDQFYFNDGAAFRLNLADVFRMSKGTGGQIEFSINHPQIIAVEENPKWELSHDGTPLMSGEYKIWPIEILPPQETATILISPDFDSITYPRSLVMLESKLLPSKTSINLILAFNAKKPNSKEGVFKRNGERSNRLQRQSVSFSNFFGDNSENRDNTWLKLCKAVDAGKIGSYWLEFSSRKNPTQPKKFELHYRIDQDAPYLSALRYLKEKSQQVDMRSIRDFLEHNRTMEDIVKDIIIIVTNFVYNRTEGARRMYNSAIKFHAQKDSFHEHTREFRNYMKNTYGFFNDLFGKEVHTGNSNGLRFMIDARQYLDQKTNKTEAELENLWSMVKHE